MKLGSLYSSRFKIASARHCRGAGEIRNRVVTLSGNSKATRTIFLPGLDAEQLGMINFPIRKKNLLQIPRKQYI